MKSKKASRLYQQKSDRLRLDVAVSHEGEMYSWVGENRFGDRSLADLVPTGATSTGAFSSFLISIFGSGLATFTREGNVSTNGRTLARFGFQVPLEKSHYSIGNRIEHATVGYYGTFSPFRLTKRAT